MKIAVLTVCTALGYGISFLLRFDLSFPAEFWGDFLVTLPVLLALRFAVNWHCGLHRHWWRFVSVPDLGRIVRAMVLGSVAFALALVVTQRATIPRSILLMEPGLTFLLVAAAMIASRQLHPGRASVSRGAGGKRVLIVGAGETGNNAARELLHHAGLKYVAIGFVDDDPHKQGALLQGIPVLGTIAAVPGLVDHYGVEEIVIAMPSAGRRRLREVMDVCKPTGARVGILPATTDLIQGRVTVNRTREVQIEDLLGRPPVVFELDTVRPLLRDAVICVTGAGGSIGSELCRQVAACSPANLLMIDRNENNLHYLHTELAERFPNVTLQPVVADVTDLLRVDRLMSQNRPRVVFQAAAYKHVPLMEHNPCEAVKNNIIGTRFLAQAADYHGTERFVMISTDKAINPTSVMGSSKRMAEMMLQGFQRTSRTRFITVRFGNVLGSDGSVVPLFTRQIARGGPVTVTHPDVVRYFMLVDEAVHLVLQASVLGEGGEIFMLDMGEPVRIIDLATDMIRLSGLEPNVDIEIRVTGLRPGEKLYEELITASEVAGQTSHAKILRLNDPGDRDWRALEGQLGEMERLALAGESESVRSMISTLVPEYQPNSNGSAKTAELVDLQALSGTNGTGTSTGTNGSSRASDRERVARLRAVARGERA